MTIKNQIQQKLHQAFTIQYLDIIDDSDKHKHHNENTGKKETHFHIIINANEFKNLALISIHRQIYKCLDAYLKTQVHALQITVTKKQATAQ